MVKGTSSGPMGAVTLANGLTTAAKAKVSSPTLMEGGMRANFIKTRPMERESTLMSTVPGMKDNGVMISLVDRVL